MTEQRLAHFARIGLRLALGTAFLSPVASRFGLWGSLGGDWPKFVEYAGQVNWYLPPNLVPGVAVASTILESVFGVLLLTGWQTRRAAYGSAALLLIFALAMATGDPKSPFDYSVFTASFGSLLLASTHKGGKKEIAE
jgi:putative oxidoreductase